MNPIAKPVPQPVRFAALSTEQAARIKKARDGRCPESNPVEAVVDRYLPKPEPEWFMLPDMKRQFADDLVKAMDKRYDTGDLLGSLPQNTRKRYRKELAELAKRLDEERFKVPDKVVEAFERAYKTAFWTLNDKYGTNYDD